MSHKIEEFPAIVTIIDSGEKYHALGEEYALFGTGYDIIATKVRYWINEELWVPLEKSVCMDIDVEEIRNGKKYLRKTKIYSGTPNKWGTYLIEL